MDAGMLVDDLAGGVLQPYLLAAGDLNADGAPMRTLSKPMVSLVVMAALMAPPTLPAAAQPTLVGGLAGVGRSRELRDRAADSETRDGFVVGAWTEVMTPVSFVGALAEAVYARRGGTFPGGGPVQSSWLAITVAPVLHGGPRPVEITLYAGPTVEFAVGTRTTTELRYAYANPTEQEFAVTAGAGLGVRLERWSVRAELRRVEGLSTTYSGGAGDLRHRSTELLVRVGRSAQGRAAPIGMTAIPSSRRHP